MRRETHKAGKERRMSTRGKGTGMKGLRTVVMLELEK